MQADTSQTLENIERQTSSSTVSRLLDLQKHGLFDVRSLDWIKRLDLLHPSAPSHKRRYDGEIVANNSRKKLLQRTYVNAYRNKKYIALSYTWTPPVPGSHGAYRVQSRNGNFCSSHVRDQVLDRAIRFFNDYKATKGRVSGFWIDQECIDQTNEVEKQCAIQSMERVYSYSACSVALLSVWIKSRSHLRNLVYILERGNPRRDQEERRIQIPDILEFLRYITSDPWWERGWTFQEDYCASTRMILLIPHSSSLTDLKKENTDLLDDLEGELCISSADFRSQATEFCMEYRENPQFKTECDTILDRAGKYNVQLLEPDNEGNAMIRRSMSPIVFSNVGKRKIAVESDRLAVIANCLGYRVRLNTKKVEQGNNSLSIAMLALFLLNGEILMNGPGNSRHALRGGIFDYLIDQSLRTFQPPDVNQKLTFIKHCRFPEVKLSEEGILTSGHLWKLRKIVRSDRPPPSLERDCDDIDYQRERLGDLAECLDSGHYGRRYPHMAGAVMAYLDEDEGWESENITFAKEYKDLMAKEIVKAMDDWRSRQLRLGFITSHEEGESSIPYHGIFISETEHPWIPEEEETYVFTAIHPPDDFTGRTEKYVSLEVELLPGSPQRGSVQLVIKRWANGLFFFNKSSPITDVVFPWPESLLGR